MTKWQQSVIYEMVLLKTNAALDRIYSQQIHDFWIDKNRVVQWWSFAPFRLLVYTIYRFLYVLFSILFYSKSIFLDESRLAGLSVYVSTGALADNQFFVHPYVFYDRGPNQPSSNIVINLQEPVLGDYVTIFNNRTNRPLPSVYSNSAILELCEVEVNGRYYRPTPSLNA